MGLFTQAAALVSYTKKELFSKFSEIKTSFNLDKYSTPVSLPLPVEPAINFEPRYKTPVDSSSS